MYMQNSIFRISGRNGVMESMESMGGRSSDSYIIVSWIH